MQQLPELLDTNGLQYLLNYDARTTMPDDKEEEENDADADVSQNSNNAFAVQPKDGGNAFAVNQKDIFGRTPLMYACEFDADGETVELLISYAAKVDAMDSNGIYTINYAAAAGQVAALKILLQTFYWNEIQFKVCPSQCAAFYGHTECLDLLLKEGIYENLFKAIEYSRRSATGCFEVLENYILTACSEDESLAELTQYFTASDQSFHRQYLSDDTFSDLSQLDTIMSRLTLDDSLLTQTQADAVPEKRLSGNEGQTPAICPSTKSESR